MVEIDPETRALLREREFRQCRDSFKYFFIRYTGVWEKKTS